MTRAESTFIAHHTKFTGGQQDRRLLESFISNLYVKPSCKITTLYTYIAVQQDVYLNPGARFALLQCHSHGISAGRDPTAGHGGRRKYLGTGLNLGLGVAQKRF